MADFDHPPIGPGSLIGAVLHRACPVRRRICSSGSASGAILATFGEIADVVGEGPPLGEDSIGHVEDFLELAVPRHQARRFVEHGDAIAHVLEGDAQFLLALADFVEQPRVLHRDHRLGGEVLQQRDLLVGEWRAPPGDRLTNDPDDCSSLTQRHAKRCARAAEIRPSAATPGMPFAISVRTPQIDDLDDALRLEHALQVRLPGQWLGRSRLR